MGECERTRTSIQASLITLFHSPAWKRDVLLRREAIHGRPDIGMVIPLPKGGGHWKRRTGPPETSLTSHQVPPGAATESSALRGEPPLLQQGVKPRLYGRRGGFQGRRERGTSCIVLDLAQGRKKHIQRVLSIKSAALVNADGLQKCWCENKGWDMHNFWWSIIVYNPHRAPVCPWGRPEEMAMGWWWCERQMTAGMLSHQFNMIA